MNMLANLTTQDDINHETDSVGGVLDSGLYGTTVDMAYLQKSKGGALGVVLTLKDVANGREHRETVYVTSGDAKGNKNYYERDGQKHYLPGFNLMNSLCLLTVGKELGELAPVKKTVKVFDFDAGKELPKEVDVLEELLGQEALVGIKKVIEDKRQRGDDGQYHPTGETREKNELDKVFRAKDKMTTAEIRAQAEEAAFYATWEQKWAGKTHDKSTKDAGQAGAPATGGSAPAAGGSSKPTQSLFS